MAAPALLIGTGLKVFGQLMANYNQSQAEILNARFYAEQAEFSRDAAIRQESLAKSAYSRLTGSQLSAYAKGNVDISGSAASVVAESLARKVEEVMAIRKKGDIEFKLAYMRSKEAQRKADLLRDPVFNLLQVAGTVVDSGAIDGIGKGSGNTKTNSTSSSSYLSGHSYSGNLAVPSVSGQSYLGGNYNFNY